MRRLRIYITIIMLFLLAGCSGTRKEASAINNEEIVVLTESPVLTASYEKESFDVKSGSYSWYYETDAIPIPFAERLLIAPQKEEVQPEIASVIYDDTLFTVLQPIEYDEDGPTAFCSKQFVISEYDCFINNLELYSNIAEGKYPHDEIYWRDYSIIDLDHDGKDELVYYVSFLDDYPGGFYMIFSVIDNDVYAYMVNFREMGTLKSDGTMEHSGGAAWCNVWIVEKFEKTGYKSKVLARLRWEDGEDAFYVGDEKVSWEDYDRFCNEERSSKGVLWTTIEADDSWLNYYSR